MDNFVTLFFLKNDKKKRIKTREDKIVHVTKLFEVVLIDY